MRYKRENASMFEPLNSKINRRALLKFIGGGGVLIPLVGISGCGKNEPGTTPAPPAANSDPSPVASTAPVAAVPAPVAESAPPSAPAPVAVASGALPHQEESDPMAKALGYRQNSAQVDAAKYPQHTAAQACHVCAQFKGAPTDAWGGCNIFVGKQVNAKGWCSAFVAKA
jgi:hypothetical protein